MMPGAVRELFRGVVKAITRRLPIGGFTGYFYLAPVGTQPPVIEPAPQRPVQACGGDNTEEEADD